MKTFLSVILCGVSFVATHKLYAQAAGSSIYQQSLQSNQVQQVDNYRGYVDRKATAHFYDKDDRMEFEVKVLLNQKADAMVAIFNVKQLGESLSSADSLFNMRLQSLINELLKIGFSPQDIFTDMIAMTPIYEVEVEKKIFSKTYNEVPKGFELQKNLHIKFTQSNVLDKIVSLAAQHEIYDLIKVEYYVQNTDSLAVVVREKALDFMSKKIASFAKVNVKLDTVYHLLTEDMQTIFPNERYQQASYSQSSTSMDALSKKSTASGSNIRKSPVLYYDKLAYSQFDVVLNPIVIEPVVQYTYSLKLKYIVKEPPKRIETQYLWLTPDGNMKTIKVN